MPELPNLVYVEDRLRAFLPGRAIVTVMVKQPIVLRVLVAQAFEAALAGARITTIERHGPFLRFGFDRDLELVIHPMLAGKFKHTPKTGKVGRGHCFSFHLDDETALHYLDDKKMGKVYLSPSGDYSRIPKYLQQGVDILSADFTMETFAALLKGQRKQVRVFLMDQTRLSAIGNAYADEILFDAGLHPKTFCYQLDQDECHQLFASIVRVMQWGIDTVKQADQPIEIKVRGHVKVRNRKDEPCPKCGATIRRAGVLGYDTYFCPACQPPKRKQFIEWN